MGIVIVIALIVVDFIASTLRLLSTQTVDISVLLVTLAREDDLSSSVFTSIFVW
jgi:hypothetical protein